MKVQLKAASNAVVLKVRGLPTASVSLTVKETEQPPQPPIAIAAADVLTGVAPMTVNLNALSSYDPDGPSLASEDWEFSDGTQASGMIVSHTFTTPGTFTASLTVKDVTGLVSTPSILTFNVKPNAAPVALFKITDTDQPTQKILDATESFDPDSQPLTYTWIVDGVAVGTNVVQPVTLTLGTHYIALVVFDSAGLSSVMPVAMTVQPVRPPLPPFNESLRVTVYHESGKSSLTPEESGSLIELHNLSRDISIDAQLIGRATSDAQFTIDFGDGTIEATNDASHLYKFPGTYTVTVKAVSSISGESSLSFSVVADEAFCGEEGEDFDCLTLSNVKANSFPTNGGRIVINDASNSTFIKDRSHPVIAKAITDSAEINIGDLVTVENGQLGFTASALAEKIPASSEPFAIELLAFKSEVPGQTTRQSVRGKIMNIQVGQTNVTFTSENYRGPLTIHAGSSYFQKTVDFNSPSMTIALPLGNVTVIGNNESGLGVHGRFELKSEGQASVTLTGYIDQDDIFKSSVRLTSPVALRAIAPTAQMNIANAVEDTPNDRWLLTYYGSPLIPLLGGDSVQQVDDADRHSGYLTDESSLWSSNVAPQPGQPLSVDCEMTDSSWLKEVTRLQIIGRQEDEYFDRRQTILDKTRPLEERRSQLMEQLNSPYCAIYICADMDAERADIDQQLSDLSNQMGVLSTEEAQFRYEHNDSIFLYGLGAVSQPVDFIVSISLKEKGEKHRSLEKQFEMTSKDYRDPVIDQIQKDVNAYSFSFQYLNLTTAAFDVDIPDTWSDYSATVRVYPKDRNPVTAYYSKEFVPGVAAKNQYSEARCYLRPFTGITARELKAPVRKFSLNYASPEANTLNALDKRLLPVSLDDDLSLHRNEWTASLGSITESAYDLLPKVSIDIPLSASLSKIEVYLTHEDETSLSFANRVALFDAKTAKFMLENATTRAYEIPIEFSKIKSVLSSWSPEDIKSKKAVLHFVPYGTSGAVPAETAGVELKEQFTLLTDLKTVTVNGKHLAEYAGQISAFANSDIVDFAIAAKPALDAMQPDLLKINDASLPFGGYFKPHASHKAGDVLDIQLPVILPPGTSTWLAKTGPNHIDGFDFLTSYAKVAVYISEHADLMTDAECGAKSQTDSTINCGDIITIDKCLYRSITDEACGNVGESRAEVNKVANFADSYARSFNQLDALVPENIGFLQSSGMDTAGPLIDIAIEQRCFATCMDKYVSGLAEHPWRQSVLLEHQILGVPLLKSSGSEITQLTRSAVARLDFKGVKDHNGHAHVEPLKGAK